MNFKSGRSADQGMRVCVLEGDTLYVSPERYEKMQLAANGMYVLCPKDGPATNPDEGAFMALLVAGLLSQEIRERLYRETKVVVDYELRR